MKIAYILNKFPTISETFVLKEILEVKRLGEDVSIYSILRPEDKLVHETAKNLTINYSDELDISKKELLGYMAKKLFTRPILLLKAIYYLRKHETCSSGVFIWFVYKRCIVLAKTIEDNKIDHMHTHFAYTSTLYLMCIHLLSGVPYSFISHAFDIFVSPKLLEQKHRYSTFAATISLSNKRYLMEQFKIPEDKIVLIRCGINIDEFPLAPYNKKHEKLMIRSVGRLVEKKGHESLIRSCKKLFEKYSDCFRCEIIGSGPLHDHLTSLIQSLHLEAQVKLLGAKTHDFVRKFVQESDVFVLPCTRGKNNDIDGIPVALMEAMALGKVTISTRISGIPELIKDDAIMVEPGDDEQLFCALERVYNMSLEERNEMGRREREKVERDFNLTEETNKIIALFKKRK